MVILYIAMNNYKKTRPRASNALRGKTHTIFSQREGESVPDSRLLLMRLRTFMGLKTWTGFCKAIDGPPTPHNIYAWVREDPEKRSTPAPKYLLKALDAALKAAAARESGLIARVAHLEGRLWDRTIPCEVCPIKQFQMPADVVARGLGVGV